MPTRIMTILFFGAQVVNRNPDEKARNRQFNPAYPLPVFGPLMLPGFYEAEDAGLNSNPETSI